MPPTSDATSGPVFRSITPSNLSTRYFPQTSDLLNNNLSPQWEVIPTVSRELNFSLLVRDNNPLGGQTAKSDIEITVDGNSEPFMVTSHNATTTLNSGEITTILWNVGNTNVAPINAPLVDIFLLVDNDFENLVPVDQDVINDGEHNVSIPAGITSSSVRIMVKAVNNVFFALNSEYLTVQQSEFVLNFDEVEYSVCQPNDLAFNFMYNTFVGFSETVTFTVENAPSGLNFSFSPETVTADNTQVEVIVSGTNNVSLGNSGFTIVATSLSLTKEHPIQLSVVSSSINAPVLLSPSNNLENVSLDQVLTWENDVNAEQYELQLSNESNFSNSEPKL